MVAVGKEHQEITGNLSVSRFITEQEEGTMPCNSERAPTGRFKVRSRGLP
jgi:hypothetical protein